MGQFITLLLNTEDFILVDKPPSWLSVASRNAFSDTRKVLSHELSLQLQRRIWSIHRLDFGVSGLVLFALNSKAHQTANDWFEKRLIKKTYEAWTEGPAPSEPGPFYWESWLLRGKKRAYVHPQGKLCQTQALWKETVSFQGKPFQKWEIRPQTGRPHQIRFELSQHGNPIAGDVLYGSQNPFLENQIALRCVTLDFSQCPNAQALGLPPQLDAKGLPYES